MNAKVKSCIYKCLSIIPDKAYLKALFRVKKGAVLDLKNPLTMDEKLQWLKLYNRKPEMTELVDKVKVKDKVAEIIGEEYIIPTLDVWEKASDIDFDALPDKFVLKTNHSGGSMGVIVCHDKSKLDKDDARKKMAASLKYDDIYLSGREWPYKNVERRIFAERLLENHTNPAEGIPDYKFYCFGGKVDCVLICIDRAIGDPKFYFFDRDWKLKRYNKRGKAAPADFTLPKPENLDKMFEIAATLSKDYPMMRVDLYNVDGKIYFGETTFFPDSGFDRNRLPETDLHFGSLIDLSMVNKK